MTTTETDSNFFVLPIESGKVRMFCGPTVLAMLTGKSREEIHRDVNKLRRKNGKVKLKTIYYRDGNYKTQKRVPWPLNSPVKGMRNDYLEALMKKYDLSPESHNKTYPSLRRLIEDIGHFKTPIVINVTGHYVLYFQGKIYDTLRKDGAPASEHPSYGQRVKKYWLVKKQKSALPALKKSPEPKLKPKKDIQIERYLRAIASAKKWTSKRKRAEKGEKKAIAKVRRYEKIFAAKKEA